MFKLQTKYLSFFFGIVSILSFFNILYSYYFNLYLNLDTYYFTLLASSILFITFFKFGKYDIKSNIFQRILTIFLGYLLIPLVLSIPFYFSIYNLTFSNSLPPFIVSPLSFLFVFLSIGEKLLSATIFFFLKLLFFCSRHRLIGLRKRMVFYHCNFLLG